MNGRNHGLDNVFPGIILSNQRILRDDGNASLEANFVKNQGLAFRQLQSFQNAVSCQNHGTERLQEGLAVRVSFHLPVNDIFEFLDIDAFIFHRATSFFIFSLYKRERAGVKEYMPALI
ncbi:MAG: hypothetical protein A4E74_02500 [Syntrophus sp. PtaB.Bin075]|nr:MAG: hypothetical protein A4E74_02500 [Syntrophus sp. PtaB.Bin075]